MQELTLKFIQHASETQFGNEQIFVILFVPFVSGFYHAIQSIHIIFKPYWDHITEHALESFVIIILKYFVMKLPH